jgi:hypothetical protein
LTPHHLDLNTFPVWQDQELLISRGAGHPRSAGRPARLSSPRRRRPRARGRAGAASGQVGGRRLLLSAAAPSLPPPLLSSLPHPTPCSRSGGRWLLGRLVLLERNCPKSRTPHRCSSATLPHRCSSGPCSGALPPTGAQVPRRCSGPRFFPWTTG